MRKRKISAKQQAAWDAERDARLVAWERWRDQAHEKEFQAKVTAWDRLRGEGLVYVPEFNATFELYACNLPGRRTWFPETACVFYERGTIVNVKFDVQFTRTFVIGVTPGVLDNEKWVSLDQSRLAFRCNEAGDAVNGLFPEP